MAKEILTQSYLKSALNYCQESGIFTHIVGSKRISPGTKAGTLHPNGYIQISINYRRYLAHRLAWLYVYGEWPPREIDHINHIRSDNRICNLRAADRIDNLKNRSLQKNSMSGITGVSWHAARRKWIAAIMVNKKYIHLGYFENIEDARDVRKQADIKYGFHENHGKVMA